MAVTAAEAKARIIDLHASSTRAVGRNMAFVGDSVLVTVIVKNVGAPGILGVGGALYIDEGFYKGLEFSEEEEVAAGEMGYFTARFMMPSRDCKVKVRAYHRRDTRKALPLDDEAELTVHLPNMIEKVEYPEEAFPGEKVTIRFHLKNLRSERRYTTVTALVNGEELRSEEILKLEPAETGVFDLRFTMPEKAEVRITAWVWQCDVVGEPWEKMQTWSGTVRRKEVPERRGEAPIVITEREYRERWEPEGWKLLVIGPTATWRREWGEWEALRDIYQNSLDEAEAYTWGYDDQGLWIADDGKGVAVRDFLLGPPKPKPDWARGKFGEGMKIAALALLRGGYSVRVDTVGREFWIVFLRQEVDGKAEQLAALWRPNGIEKGTRWHIIGYFGPAYEDRIAVNIPRKNILFEAPSLLHEPRDRRNQLIDTPPGRIYARDIYMRDIDSPWSYNLWDFEMAPDRHGPKREEDVNISMGRLWACCTDVDLLKRFLSMIVVPPRERSKEMDVSFDFMGTEPRSGKRYTQIMKENGDIWREAWRREFGDNMVIRTSDRLDPMVRHLGYESVSLTWSTKDALEEIITTDRQLVRESQERLSGVEVILDERLGPQELAHLNLARAIAHDICYGLEGVSAAVIPPASDRTRTAGMYDRNLKMIYIGLDQLSRARTTVDTVIHEIAHHTSGAEDGTEEHNREMTSVAAKVVERTAKGRYDAWLKDAVW